MYHNTSRFIMKPKSILSFVWGALVWDKMSSLVWIRITRGFARPEESSTILIGV